MEPFFRLPSLKRKPSERRIFPPKQFDRGSAKRSSLEPPSPLQSKPTDITGTFPNIFDSKVNKPETVKESETVTTTNPLDLKIPSLDMTVLTSSEKTSERRIFTPKDFDRESAKISSMEPLSPMQSKPTDIAGTFPNIFDSKVNELETKEPEEVTTTNLLDLRIPSLNMTSSQPPEITPQQPSTAAPTYQFSKVPVTETYQVDGPLISLEDTSQQPIGITQIKSTYVPTKHSVNTPFSEIAHSIDLVSTVLTSVPLCI